ncbi:MAG: hypothetical protein K6A29_05375 [Lachnospiraceae bacterium]|nr:hypothetical protein [Lachnospiraceae bacterium]
MKRNKLLGIVGVLLLTALIIGCGEKDEPIKARVEQNKQTVKSILEDAKNEDLNTSADNDSINETSVEENTDTSSLSNDSEQPESPEVLKTSEDEDYIDLTALNSIMVYTEVYNMMYYPENYEGKTVKAKGMFNYCEATEEEKSLYGNDYYFYTVIQDATACCQQGLEFVLKDDPGFPEGYPKMGEEVTVCGRFEIYYEGETMYAHLVDATFEF